MGILDRIRTLVGLQKSALTGMNHASNTPMIHYPDNWYQLGMNPPSVTGGGSVVESCVQAYAQTVAQLPGRHYELDEDGTKTYVMGSRLARVLAKPNSFPDPI